MTSSDPFDAPERKGYYRDERGILRDSRWDRPYLTNPATGKEASWTRATTLAKTLADTYNIDAWRLRMLARGLTIGADDLLKLASTTEPTGPGAAKTYADEIVEPALDRAGANAGRRRGTALHNAAQDWLTGTPAERLPEWTRPFIASMKAELDRQIITIDASMIEVFTAAPEVMAAGRADYGRCVRPDWTAPRLGDLKTQAHDPRETNALEIEVQLAIYVRGLNSHGVYNPVTDNFTPLAEKLDESTAIVIWLPSAGEHEGTCQVLEVDIALGWQMALASQRTRGFRTDAKRAVRALQPPVTIPASTSAGSMSTSVFAQPSPVADAIEAAFTEPTQQYVVSGMIDGKAVDSATVTPSGPNTMVEMTGTGQILVDGKRPRRTKVQLEAARALVDMRAAGCICPGDDHLGVVNVIDTCPFHSPEMPGHGDKTDLRAGFSGTHDALQAFTDQGPGPAVAAAQAAGTAGLDALIAESVQRDEAERAARLARVDPIIAIRAKIMQATYAEDLSDIWLEHRGEWSEALTKLGQSRRLPSRPLAAV